MAVRDPRVDAYIDRLPRWQAALCRDLRDLIHTADPEIEETIKRTVQPYFVLDGNVCALLAAKNHVNLFIYDPHVADPDQILNQGHGNATTRALQIYEGEAINQPALLTLIRAVISRNRAGGWRRLDTR
jgi:hypothetical protein